MGQDIPYLLDNVLEMVLFNNNKDNKILMNYIKSG